MFCKLQNKKMKLNRIKIIGVALVCFICIISCKQINLQEQNIGIPQTKWQSNLYSNSSFEITDTAGVYIVYIVIRHTDAYEYSNIWLNVGLQKAGETMKFQKQNLSLAKDAKGWDGVGMNDIWEVRREITRVALKKGTYNTSVGHIMRQNPLLHILNIGVRVEKISS
jgi:gliding motility-associated lipoprotein GldH